MSLAPVPPKPDAKIRPRIGHRKSRGGCLHCKRRKVKCDETKPECWNCTRFKIPCSFTTSSSTEDSNASPKGTSNRSAESEATQLPFLPARGRGRPRRDWAVRHVSPASSNNSLTSCAKDLEPSESDSTSSEILHELQMDQAKLLHQFITITGPSLSEHPDDSISRFWSLNAPQIGFQYPFVLHLVLALASYHLAHLNSDEQDAASRYRSLAKRHNSEGLAGLSTALPALNNANCGSIYISTMLVGLCTLAAGPSGPDDLLVCDVNASRPGKWLPLARGVRLIHTLSDQNALFAGLMEPLGPSKDADADKGHDPRPKCDRCGFPRLEWTGALGLLRTYITENVQQTGSDCRLHSLQVLEEVYEANFGRGQAIHTSTQGNEHVMKWLYVMEDSFVSHVQNKDPLALLVLFYFAPLLATIKDRWFMTGWADHLLVAIQTQLDHDYDDLLDWPRQAVSILNLG